MFILKKGFQRKQCDQVIFKSHPILLLCVEKREGNNITLWLRSICHPKKEVVQMETSLFCHAYSASLPVIQEYLVYHIWLILESVA